MGARVKVKVQARSVTDAEDLAELSTMLSQLQGNGDSDIRIVKDLYLRLRNSIHRSAKILSVLADFKPLYAEFPSYLGHSKVLKKFLESLKTVHGIVGEEDAKKYESSDEKSMNIAFNTLKESKEVKNFVATCGILDRYKDKLKEDALDDSFITKESDLKPFVGYFPIDIVMIWKSEETDAVKNIKKLILLILSKLSVTTYETYDSATSPTVDIARISDLMINSLASIRKKIPRCDEAFNLISNSGDLMKKNFKKYFRQSKESGSKNLIAENFLLDLLQTKKGDTKLKFQFRQILKYLRKTTAEAPSNPGTQKINRLVGMMNRKVDRLFGLQDDAKDEETAGSTESTESADPVESTESVEPPEPAESTETADPVDTSPIPEK